MQILSLLAISFAPILIILFYIYFRDKYEKEPIGILLKTFIAGTLITIPIIYIEISLGNFWSNNFEFKTPKILSAGYNAFVVAALTEELFKFTAFFILVWRNKNFNENFDGIVYALFISLGFATVENVLYVFQNGMGTGLLRAFTAVPAHALFGIAMGYYLGLAKNIDFDKTKNVILGFFIPFILHGIYDFILMSEINFLLLFFIPFIIFMFIFGMRKMKEHSINSIFKPSLNLNENENQINPSSDINNF